MNGENDMAKEKPQGKPAANRAEYGAQSAPAPSGDEAVNSEQLEALEAKRTAQEPPAAPQRVPGPDVGELEERTAEAENRAEAAERRNAELAAEMQIMREQLAKLMQQARSPQSRSDAREPEILGDGTEPVFQETEPHGIVVGDTEVAYVQDGHQFGRDRRYLRTEKHRGVPRAFNPRLVGWVKPRANQPAVDALDGFRDS
jgi:hypothetical protein